MTELKKVDSDLGGRAGDTRAKAPDYKASRPTAAGRPLQMQVQKQSQRQSGAGPPLSKKRNGATKATAKARATAPH